MSAMTKFIPILLMVGCGAEVGLNTPTPDYTLDCGVGIVIDSSRGQVADWVGTKQADLDICETVKYIENLTGRSLPDTVIVLTGPMWNVTYYDHGQLVDGADGGYFHNTWVEISTYDVGWSQANQKYRSFTPPDVSETSLSHELLHVAIGDLAHLSKYWDFI
jgi:hypothetical protein